MPVVLVLALLGAAVLGAVLTLAAVRLRARRPAVDAPLQRSAAQRVDPLERSAAQRVDPLERSAAQRVDPLEDAERLKRELIAVVSHEFRTPLTSIRGFAQTLDERGERMDRSAVHSCLAAIEGQSRRLERIVANVLSIGEVPDPETAAAVDFGCVATLVISDLRDLWGAEAERIMLDVEPGLRLRMSATAAALVFENLLDNALKFGRSGTPVRLRGRRRGTDLVFAVTDRGDPIPHADLPRIFEPFVQGDSSDTRRASGMGLGLATVSRLVAAHGGRVEARNAPPDVVVTVTLPAGNLVDLAAHTPVESTKSGWGRD